MKKGSTPQIGGYGRLAMNAAELQISDFRIPIYGKLITAILQTLALEAAEAPLTASLRGGSEVRVH